MTKEIRGNVHSYSKQKLKLQKNRTLRKAFKYLIIITILAIFIWFEIK
jgi:hypothetical protein